MSPFDNLGWVHLILFHEGIVIVLKVNSSWVFQFDGFINRFHTSIRRSFDFFAGFIDEFLNNVSFHNRFFNLTIDVGNRLGPFDNLGWVNLILFHEGIVIIFKVDSGWMFQFNGFIDWFHSSICRSFDFFTSFIDEFLNDVSFHYRFFNRFLNFFVDVGNDLSSFNNFSWIHLVLFHESIIIVFEVNSGWVFQFDGFIDWFNAGISRSLDFFAGFVHEFLDNVSFCNRFFNLTIDVGNRLSTFDNLGWVHLILFHEGIVIVLKVNSSWVFQFDGFINRFHTSIRRSFDFFAGFIDEFLNNVSFHNRFFNLTIDVGNRLGPFDNLGWVNLILFHEGIVIIFKVDSGWMFQFNGFIDWFHSSICRSFDFFTSFIDELLNHISFHYGLFNFFIEVGNGFTESVWNFRWIHLVLTDEFVGFSFELNGFRMCQVERFTNRLHTRIRLWG